jgi:NADH-quinone oxidoreductase subunit M
LDLITLITFIPAAGAVVLLAFPRGAHGLFRWFSLLVTLAAFAVSIKLLVSFETVAPMQFVKQVPWIESLGISYKVGIDGISLFLVMLVTFIMPITVLSCFGAIKDRLKEFYFSMLILETAMIGAFVALDLFLFYVFWEAMLIPMYFLIGMWGGERRIYAAVKFFIYTMIGSLLMLVAILYVVYAFKTQNGYMTFDYFQLKQVLLSPGEQWLLFLAFALAFAIKVPMFPFHTWLPDAHVEAPTAGSVILAGVLLKMGTYGFIRFAMPMFPVAALRAIPLISIVAIIGIIYGACVAMVQKDVKKLVAYSSVSHLGFVMLGLFALNTHAVEGAIYQMLNHGISTGALFLLVGVVYERRHTRLIADYGGLTKVMPIYAVYFMIFTLSSIGLPPLNGFVGEFMILVGAFQANVVYGVLAATGVVLGAIYMLWMYQRVFFGEVTHQENEKLKDLSFREIIVFTPLILMVFVMGVYSKPFISKMEPSVNKFIEEVNYYRGLAEGEMLEGVEVSLPAPPALGPAERQNEAATSSDGTAVSDRADARAEDRADASEDSDGQELSASGGVQ